MAVATRTPSADVPKVGQTIGKYTIVAELGHRAPPTFAAHAAAIGSADPELVVIEAIAPSSASAAENDVFVKRARRLAQTRHPNVGRLRDVVVSRDRIVVASDFVEGETLAELLALDAKEETRRFGLAEQLRILVDVLSGMSSIHLAPRLTGEPNPDETALFHGAIHPKNIVVGVDGSSRLIRAARGPNATSADRTGTIEEPNYAAPELLLGDATSGAGVDIYSVGVLLWEVLSGARLFPEDGEKDILARQLAGPLERATPPKDAPWADALVDVAARALDVDPEKRFLSTAELAGALRLAVQARLAPTSRVANVVMATASEKIAERKARLRATKQKSATAAVPQLKAAQPTNLAASALPAKGAIANAPKILDRNAPKMAAPEKNLAARAASEPDEVEAGPATKRMQVQSLADDDLLATDDDAIDSKWSSAPPAKKPSVAPPLKKPSIAPPLKKPSIAPPLKRPSIAPPLPTRVGSVAPSMAAAADAVFESAPPLPLIFPEAPLVPEFEANEPPPPPAPTTPPSNENIAPVVFQSHVTPAISSPMVPADYGSGTVILTPAEDPQRRRRVIVVLGMVAIAALILLIAGVKHLASGPSDTSTIATATTSSPTSTKDPNPPSDHASDGKLPTSPAATTPTATPTPDPIPTPVTPPEPTSQPLSVSTSTPPPPTSAPIVHDTSGRPASTPTAKPVHKRPPHSTYEPEGI